MSKNKLLFIGVLVLALSLVAGVAYAAAIPRVTGIAKVYLPTVDGGWIYATSGMQVYERPDGSIRGRAKGVIHNTGQMVMVDVSCLNVFDTPLGTAAVMSGEVIASNDPDVMPYWTFFVVDSGDGPDYTWYAKGSSGPEERNCIDFGTGWSYRQIYSGDIVVH